MFIKSKFIQSAIATTCTGLIVWYTGTATEGCHVIYPSGEKIISRREF